ncbi:MAG: hypothetical protein KME09_06900 [Pleurocapsa minor HA4230-MV1]|jgi:hypothetical protein|nr:hypothetical protein [Pleurocapsa minor HA4230-MV1]
MALCSNGQKPTIEWQYAGEDKQQIIGADSYSLNPQSNKCPVRYHAFGTFMNKTLPDCNKIYSWRTSAAIIGSDVATWDAEVKPVSSTWGIRLKNNNYGGILLYDRSPNYNVNLLTDYPAQSWREQPFAQPCINTTASYGTNFKTIDVVRVDGLTANCTECLFKITKNNVVVYQKATPTCPIVTHFCGDQCPPGTCQCDCGSEVCCYDTKTGKAVKSFRK